MTSSRKSSLTVSHCRQPGTLTAPILLRHICASWRRLALASPTLWVHLSYCLTVVEYIGHWDSGFRRVEFVERDMEFIRWWRLNVESASDRSLSQFRCRQAPARRHNPKTIEEQRRHDHLTSAQYLELDIFYWCLIHERVQAGDPIVFPNLNTVLLEHTWVENNPFYELRTFLPHALPALEHLSITELTPPNDFAVLYRWSTLTHLSLHISMTLDFWLSLFRALPHLWRTRASLCPATRSPCSCPRSPAQSPSGRTRQR
jgi:hypothetical protein